MTKIFHKFIPLAIFCILIICLIPFVSAEDISNNNTMSGTNVNLSDSLNSNNSGYNWYISSNVNESGDGSESHPFKTIQEGLDANTGGQSIYISNGTYLVSNYELNKSVNLIGESNENTIISAFNNTHIFIINSKFVTVSLNNLTFTNGSTVELQEVGGAIQKNDGVLTINNCIFKNNSAQYGGAIYNLIGKLTVNNSKFINNTIVNTGCDGGAAIYDLYGTGNIYNTIFIDNLAYKQNGGAIYQNKGYLNVYNSTFINNQASQSGIGGAIYLNDRTYSTIVQCLFKGNSAYGAGAIYSANALNGLIGSCLIDKCTFDSNTGRLNGGAVINYWYYSLMTIQNSIFTNNTSKTGGAIYNEYSTLTLKNNTIINCEAYSKGNEIYNLGILSNVYITLLNNQTIKVNNGDIVNITASITDDNDNTITGGLVNLLVDGMSISNLTSDEGLISANYTVNHEGQSVIAANYSQAENVILKTAVLDTTSSIITVLSGENFTENYGQGLNYTAKLSDSKGNPLVGQHIGLNLTRLSSGASKVYWVTTDTEGNVYLPINLSPGSYLVQGTYYGNETCLSSNCNNSIEVLSFEKNSTLLTVNKFIGVYGVAQNLTGILQTISGSPLVGQHIGLNLTRLSSGASKVYWVTTDTEGAYQLAINLAPGNYTVVCSYAGSDCYSSVSNSTTMVVNP